MRKWFTLTFQASCCSLLLWAANAYATDTSPIPLELPSPASAPVAEKTEATVPPAQVPVASEAGEVVPQDAKPEPEVSWRGSLMFFPADLKAVRDALEEAKNTPDTAEGIGGIVSDISNSMKSFMPNIVANLAPTYYLNSILYVSPDNWSIWVNGIKYSAKTQRFAGGALEELHVERVSPQGVRFKAKVRLLDRISPHWQEKFTPNVEGDFEANAVGDFYINKEKDHISFTLQPNQRLDLAHMEVSEGKME